MAVHRREWRRGRVADEEGHAVVGVRRSIGRGTVQEDLRHEALGVVRAERAPHAHHGLQGIEACSVEGHDLELRDLEPVRMQRRKILGRLRDELLERDVARVDERPICGRHLADVRAREEPGHAFGLAGNLRDPRDLVPPEHPGREHPGELELLDVPKSTFDLEEEGGGKCADAHGLDLSGGSWIRMPTARTRAPGPRRRRR